MICQSPSRLVAARWSMSTSKVGADWALSMATEAVRTRKVARACLIVGIGSNRNLLLQSDETAGLSSTVEGQRISRCRYWCSETHCETFRVDRNAQGVP